MSHSQMTFSVDPAIAAALAAMARCRRVSCAELVQELIEAAITQKGRSTFDHLRGAVSVDFEMAASWPELQGRLRLKGFDLRGLSGQLVIVSHPSGDLVCDLSEVGVQETVLCRRFGRSFPTVSNRWDWELELDGHDHASRPSSLFMSVDQAAKG